jgi:hypothetical protein
MTRGNENGHGCFSSQGWKNGLKLDRSVNNNLQTVKFGLKLNRMKAMYITGNERVGARTCSTEACLKRIYEA